MKRVGTVNTWMLCAVSNSVLADYEYVQQCLNLDHDIKFVIVDVDSIQKPFQRVVRQAHWHMALHTTTVTLFASNILWSCC